VRAARGPARLSRNARELRRQLHTIVLMVALAVLGLGTGAYLVAHERIQWPSWVPLLGQRYFHLSAEVSAVSGVLPGQRQAVTVSGVTVGQISGVTLRNGVPIVSMNIDPQYARRIYPNATVMLRPKTGLGDMVAELDPGSPSAGPPLCSGATLGAASTLPTVNLDEILAELDADTRAELIALVDNGQALSGNGGRELGDVFRDFNPLSRDVERASHLVALRSVDPRRQTLTDAVRFQGRTRPAGYSYADRQTRAFPEIECARAGPPVRRGQPSAWIPEAIVDALSPISGRGAMRVEQIIGADGASRRTFIRPSEQGGGASGRPRPGRRRVANGRRSPGPTAGTALMLLHIGDRRAGRGSLREQLSRPLGDVAAIGQLPDRPVQRGLRNVEDRGVVGDRLARVGPHSLQHALGQILRKRVPSGPRAPLAAAAGGGRPPLRSQRFIGLDSHLARDTRELLVLPHQRLELGQAPGDPLANLARLLSQGHSRPSSTAIALLIPKSLE
jgi:hypothetical protein